ncbi:MAG: hypothetical protein U1E28_21030 [Beijerinckiaceae bacterium]
MPTDKKTYWQKEVFTGPAGSNLMNVYANVEFQCVNGKQTVVEVDICKTTFGSQCGPHATIYNENVHLTGLAMNVFLDLFHHQTMPE